MYLNKKNTLYEMKCRCNLVDYWIYAIQVIKYGFEKIKVQNFIYVLSSHFFSDFDKEKLFYDHYFFFITTL